MKDLAKNMAIGVLMPIAMFYLIEIIFDIGYDSNFNLYNYRFTKIILDCVLVALGLGTPTRSITKLMRSHS